MRSSSPTARVLDTRDPASRAGFRAQRADLLQGWPRSAGATRADATLAARIRAQVPP